MKTTLPNHPLQPVRDHIASLRGIGMSTVAIAAASGIPVATVRSVASGRVGHVYGHTARQILAVEPAYATAPAGFVDVTRPRRQVQALAVIGHSLTYQRERTGIVARRMYLLTSGRSRFLCSRHAAAVDALYDELYATDGGSLRSITYAGRHGWVGPQAWDEHTIGDPKATPFSHLDGYTDDVAVAQALDGNHHVARRLTDLERRAAVHTGIRQGLSRNQLIENLRMGPSTIERFRRELELDGVAA
jgi:hypothetical protein